MVTPQQAIDEYISALREVGADLYSHHFKFEGGYVRLGHGREDDLIQWGMTRYTPEELFVLAKRRRLNLKTGDPKKPTPQKYT